MTIGSSCETKNLMIIADFSIIAIEKLAKVNNGDY